MDIIETLKNRYSTKEFDSSKKLSDEKIAAIEDLLQLSPSSTNLQPWYFVLAKTEEGKQKIASSAKEFHPFNVSKILDASLVVVFAAKTMFSEDYSEHIVNVEDEDGRYEMSEMKDETHKIRVMFANMHQYEYKDFHHWAEKQVFLNLGNFLLGVAALGLDAIAIEGVDLKTLDDVCGLRKKGYSSCFVVSVGYHKESDINKSLPKSRLPKDEILEYI